jgi:hypothetical protein
VFWTVAFAAVLFLSSGFAYHGKTALSDLWHCVYLRPDCSVAAGTWALALITSLALVAAASAYFLEVEPLLTCRQLADDDEPPPRSTINVYVTAHGDNHFLILVDQEPMAFDARRYTVAHCCFANAGRSALLELSATLSVVRSNRVMRPDSWDGLPVEVLERRRERQDIPLDHLTASDNESRRSLCVAVYRDLELSSDTTVRWTGAATWGGRRFWFRPPPDLVFEAPERRLPRVSVPGGGGS